MTPTDLLRAALKRLTIMASNELDTPGLWAHTKQQWDDAIATARAALAEPVVERPPAVTIGALLHPAYEPGDGSADGAQMVGMAWWHPVMGCDSLQIVVDNARAVLARFGNHSPGAAKMVSPAPVPAEGEVE